MNSIKCKNCGLSNFPMDVECRRCGYSFLKTPKTKKEKTPSRFSLSSLLMIAVVVGLVYYFYSGTQDSVAKVKAEDEKRVASQPAEKHVTPGLSRTQQD